jgi:K+-sensing histidine kinase KdpD
VLVLIQRLNQAQRNPYLSTLMTLPQNGRDPAAPDESDLLRLRQLAHDLRTPLSVISMGLEILKQVRQDEEQFTRAVTMISASSQELAAAAENDKDEAARTPLETTRRRRLVDGLRAPLAAIAQGIEILQQSRHDDERFARTLAMIGSDGIEALKSQIDGLVNPA